MFLLFLILAFLSGTAVAGNSAKETVRNCGTIQNIFKMGELLRSDSRGCHALRWPAMNYHLEEGCMCSFYE